MAAEAFVISFPPTWSAVSVRSGEREQLRLIPTSLVEDGIRVFEIRDARLSPLLIWDEDLGVTPGADPVPVRWPGPLPSGVLRLDVRGVDPLHAVRFWESIAVFEGMVTSRGVRRAISLLSSWDDLELGRWAETMALVASRVWDSLRKRSEFADDWARGGFDAIGAVIGRGEEACESVIRDSSAWSPTWVRSDECFAVLWLATLALSRRRRGLDVFVYTSFTDEENHIRALASSVKVDGFSGEAALGAVGDDEVVALSDRFPDDPEALIAALADLASRPDAHRHSAVAATPREYGGTCVVRALVDYEGFLKSRVVIVDLPEDPQTRDARARAAVEVYGGVVREIVRITDELPEGIESLPQRRREVSFS